MRVARRTDLIGQVQETPQRLGAAERRIARLAERPAWTSPSLLNGWINFGTGFPTCQYRKFPSGLVEIKGLVKNGTVGTATPVFTLPTDYRPGTNRIWATDTGTGHGRVDVATNGNVVVVSGGNAYVSLDVMQFFVGD